jgi:Raf kinase inhibitor-like YbhB/YbcL family protein
MTRLVKWLALVALIWGSAASAADPQKFQLTSSVAPPMGRVPAVNTCDGQGISPPLAWTGVPDKTQAFVLIMRDPDATSGTFYHWVWYDIPKSTTELPAGALPPTGTMMGVNSANRQGYFAPCPPPGHLHHYIFSLYALDLPVALSANADAGTVMGAMQSHVIGIAEDVMTFNR